MVSDRRAFGERLKRQRERRGVSLQSICQSTKIPAGLFAGLERGDCSRWPAGLYARAYVRAYAEAVGIDPDEAVDEFSRLFAAHTKSDGTEVIVPRSPRTSAALRLSIVPEPAVTPARIARRAGLAAADVAVGLVLALIAHLGLNAGVSATVGVALAYQALGRLVSDEPLICWVYQHLRTSSVRRPEPEEAEDVPVGDTASTTA